MPDLIYVRDDEDHTIFHGPYIVTETIREATGFLTIEGNTHVPATMCYTEEEVFEIRYRGAEGW